MTKAIRIEEYNCELPDTPATRRLAALETPTSRMLVRSAGDPVFVSVFERKHDGSIVCRFSEVEKRQVFNAFSKFVKSGFSKPYFTQKLYGCLSNLFGFIAHYNLEGFFAVYFSDPVRQYEFCQHILEHPRPYVNIALDLEEEIRNVVSSCSDAVRRSAEAYVTRDNLALLRSLIDKYPKDAISYIERYHGDRLKELVTRLERVGVTVES